MKTKNFSLAKMIAVTMMLGLFSPSITIENIESPSQLTSEGNIDFSQGLLGALKTSDISISLFTQAKARRGRGMARRGGRRAGRRAGRRTGRRANYRRAGGHYHGGGYYGRPYYGGAAVVGGMVAGAAVGAAISSMDDCRIIYIDGLRYRDCGGSIVRY